MTVYHVKEPLLSISQTLIIHPENVYLSPKNFRRFPV